MNLKFLKDMANINTIVWLKTKNPMKKCWPLLALDHKTSSCLSLFIQLIINNKLSVIMMMKRLITKTYKFTFNYLQTNLKTNITTMFTKILMSLWSYPNHLLETESELQLKTQGRTFNLLLTIINQIKIIWRPLVSNSMLKMKKKLTFLTQLILCENKPWVKIKLRFIKDRLKNE